jgi:hypothetical protein
MRTAVIFVTLTLNVFVLASTLVPATASFWRPEAPADFYVRLTTLVGFQFALLSAAVVLMLRAESADANTWRSELLSRLPSTLIEPLRDLAFYPQFLAAAANASHRVDICYFAPHPPHQINRPYRDRYYTQLLDTIRDSPNVHFRRIVRRTPPNEDWVAELVRDLDGLPNAHIATLPDRPERDPMPLALSVQVVDNHDAWLVAVRSHDVDEFRDLHVRDATFASVAEAYFSRLWDMSTKIMENGITTAEGNNLLQRVARR